jgi:hypothetical protein
MNPRVTCLVPLVVNNLSLFNASNDNVMESPGSIQSRKPWDVLPRHYAWSLRH